MAKMHELTDAAQALGNIAERIKLCESIARALIDTGQPWIGDPEHDNPHARPTDYAKARRQVMQRVKSVVRQLRSVRRHALSPDAIRGEAAVAGILGHCGLCPETNRQRQVKGEVFQCLVRHDTGQLGNGGFRFSLDGQGQILERQ